ncbi:MULTISPECIES: DUF6377 domain-containing protein [Bacteroidaceae]|uniref:DUF6377 domain-containing protein n=1 Tax=Bacteroidaceae TaxID=815 RepID=UPI0023F73A1F|nr:DUF6377 domain-containing protein [Bacteroides congonensis]
MKKCLLSGLFLLFVLLPFRATNKVDLSGELETALKLRNQYSRQKETRIDSLKHLLYPNMNDDKRFLLYNAIYEEYYTYRFDSAIYYVDREEEVAMKLSNPTYRNLSIIHRSILLATSGYFSESIQNLEQIDSRTLDNALRIEYYTAYEWAYSMWAEYSNDNIYAPRYYEKEMLYQDSLISVLPVGSPLHHYWKGENFYRHRRYAEAKNCYKKALEGLPVNVRLFAMATYGLALVYSRTNNWKEYENYLIKAAISDQVCPLKENLALQELALYIFKNRDGEVSRANRYLNYSLEDAMYYNNRLRMLEIARKFPSIVLSYQKQNLIESQRLQWSLICISLLSIGLVVSLVYIYRQMNQLHKRKKILANMNCELQHLNKALVDTNHTREEYVSLFMDLCAAYIDKLKKYQDLVKRKVKAKQTDDLLRLVNATKLSEMDTREFFMNFDTAFLNLYPNFIKEFNSLLREGEEIIPKRGEILTTELRIFALIRMGIKDSSKIATLLFYSPQTIYNHRSVVKNKAKIRDNFEKQVEEICTINLLCNLTSSASTS